MGQVRADGAHSMQCQGFNVAQSTTRSTLGFGVKARSFQVLISIDESEKQIISALTQRSTVAVSHYDGIDGALYRVAQSPCWMLVWAWHCANLSLRTATLSLPARQWLLVRAGHADINTYQNFCGTILIFGEDTMSSQDLNLFSRHAEDSFPDTGWARLLSAYVQGLDADTLQRLGDGASGRSLLEHQVMELLRRALLERQDSTRFWNRRDDVDDVQYRGEVLFKRICAWIAENFSDLDMGCELVAGHFNISPRYIQTLFSKYGEGMTFVSFLRENRLSHAQNLLMSKAYAHQSISEIAWSCGFSDPVYFGKSFHECFGKTPGQARRHSS